MPKPLPKYWYFPIDANHALRCEYNEATGRYDTNCTTVSLSELPDRLGSEMVRFSNAITKYT